MNKSSECASADESFGQGVGVLLCMCGTLVSSKCNFTPQFNCQPTKTKWVTHRVLTPPPPLRRREGR
jgi:hypothetical protein